MRLCSFEVMLATLSDFNEYAAILVRVCTMVVAFNSNFRSIFSISFWVPMSLVLESISLAILIILSYRVTSLLRLVST